MGTLPDVNGDVRKFLAANSFTVLDFTKPIHAIKYKFPLYRRPGNPFGVVLHNTSGMVELPNLVGTWQKKNVPSHFAVDQTGKIGQYVMLDFADRATEGTNRHVSIELQAVIGGGITGDQLEATACICGFLHGYFGTTLAIAMAKNEPGIAHHALFVDPKNPEGHMACPGAPIIARKAEIILKAIGYAAKVNVEGNPTGSWTVRIPDLGGLYRYDFTAIGEVKWTDYFNGQSGKGTWSSDGRNVNIRWPSTGSTDTWPLPLANLEHQVRTNMKSSGAHDMVADRMV